MQIPEDEKPIYAVYEDESGKWRVQAVPVSLSSFESRKALPEPWRGIRDEALSELSGIKGCIFVHQSGFIGGEFSIPCSLQSRHRSGTDSHSDSTQATALVKARWRWPTRRWNGHEVYLLKAAFTFHSVRLGHDVLRGCDFSPVASGKQQAARGISFFITQLVEPA
jgi:Uncharacterised protein family (UPF0160)